MAHINPPTHLTDFRRFTGFELGLEVGQIVHTIPRTGRRRVFTNWAKWTGRFVIERLKQSPEYDNTKPLDQDVQTWLDALHGQDHTTEIPIVEPTIEPPGGWVPAIDTPVIEDGLLALTVTGTSAGQAAGLMCKVGTNDRLYKIVDVQGSKWLLTPAILPVGSDAELVPKVATSLRVRVLTPSAQYRAKSGRGGWDVSVEEAI